MRKKSSSSVRAFYPNYTKEEIAEKISNQLPFLSEQLPLRLVVLFGSYAKGNYTIASDIDLLIVYKGPEREDAFALSKRTIGIPHLEPHVYSESQYGELKETIEKMTRDGVVLYSSGSLPPDAEGTGGGSH
jgi:predicted nucleotidyltransferase